MHTITFAHENDSLIIFIERDIDHHNAAKLRNEIDETMSLISAKKLILDFDSVEFMDSSGIGLIMGRYKKIQGYGGNLYLKNLNNRCRRLVELSGILQIVEIIE
ncbi:MAG: anti-sigma factor antagonist [Oscillospiraceae bacterium]